MPGFHSNERIIGLPCFEIAPSPLPSAQLLLRIQPQITHHLLAAIKSFGRPDNQQKANDVNRSYSRISRQTRGQRVLGG